jgi:hypothetical protein
MNLFRFQDFINQRLDCRGRDRMVVRYTTTYAIRPLFIKDVYISLTEKCFSCSTLWNHISRDRNAYFRSIPLSNKNQSFIYRLHLSILVFCVVFFVLFVFVLCIVPNVSCVS